MKLSSKSVLGAAILVAAVSVASQAKASIILYPTLSADGITLSNITETNANGSGTYNYGDPGAPSYYGPGTFDGSIFNIPITGTLPFAASAGANDSDLLGVKLSFDVTSQSPLLAAAFLSEIGDFFAGGGGSGGIDNSIFVFSSNGTPLASNVGTVEAPLPFTSGTTDTDMIWTATAGASGNVLATTFHVVIDNDLHAAGSTNPASFAFIEKKGITIDIGTGSGGGPNTPEPATLGVLSLGALTLIARRRRTA